MQFRNLPPEIKIGAIDLKLLSHAALTPCQMCDCIDLVFMTCRQGHVTCTDCAFEIENDAYPRLDRSPIFWCTICDDWVDSTCESISENLVTRLRFRCNCSFSGTLREISSHLQSPETGMECFMTDAERQRRSLEAKQSASMNELANILDIQEDKLDQLKSKWHCDGPKFDQICRTVDAMMSLARMQLLYFDLNDLRKQHSIRCTNRGDLFGAGYSIELGRKLIRDNDWLTLSVVMKTMVTKKSVPHYLIFRVHDVYGGVMFELTMWATKGKTVEYYYRLSENSKLVENVPLLRLDLIHDDAYFHKGKLVVSLETSS